MFLFIYFLSRSIYAPGNCASKKYKMTIAHLRTSECINHTKSTVIRLIMSYVYFIEDYGIRALQIIVEKGKKTRNMLILPWAGARACLERGRRSAPPCGRVARCTHSSRARAPGSSNRTLRSSPLPFSLKEKKRKKKHC